MMKKLLSLLLCILLLCGCARKPAPTEPSDPTEEPTQGVVEVDMATEPPVLKYAGVQLQYLSLLSENDPEARVLKLAAAEFEQTTGAKVELKWYNGNMDGLQLTLSGQDRPDLFEATGIAMETLKDEALDLTELVKASGYEGKSWEVLRTQILERCDTLKAVAIRPTLYGLYYNQEVFEVLAVQTPPSSWEEYLAFCQLLKDQNYECLVIDQERSHIVLELLMERALGWEGIRTTMVEEAWRKIEMGMLMIQEAIDFAEKGYLVKGTPAAFPNGQNRLGHSNAVFVAGPTSLCYEVEQACLADMNWGVMPHPGNGPGSGLLVDADVLAITSDCANPEAAFAFAQLVTTGGYDQLRADVSVGIPADPNNSSVIAGANDCMAIATAKAPRWFDPGHSELFCRLWNGYYKTGKFFASQLNEVSHDFDSEKSVG